MESYKTTLKQQLHGKKQKQKTMKNEMESYKTTLKQQLHGEKRRKMRRRDGSVRNRTVTTVLDKIRNTAYVYCRHTCAHTLPATLTLLLLLSQISRDYGLKLTISYKPAWTVCRWSPKSYCHNTCSGNVMRTMLTEAFVHRFYALQKSRVDL